jgi:pyruvate ferredoxin oxidoreductase beta subunit
MTNVKNEKKRQLLSPGYNSCAGCGEMIAIRAVTEALGPNTIIVNATGCSEVTTTLYPQSSWGMPWIHSLFENASAVASGIKAALDYKSLSLRRRGLGEVKKNPPNPLKSPYAPFNKGGIAVVAQGGDGATFDIGLGLISGMWERGDDVLYICYDTESYSNTGRQASGATPWGANTPTTPAGKPETIEGIGFHQKTKDMIAIALAHGVKYVAQTTSGFPLDIEKKVKKALTIKGPRYIQILTPCVPGWIIDTSKTVKMGKLAAQTGLYPVIEYENGQLTSALKIPKPAPKVDEYLKMQGRFSHLFKTELGKKQIEHIQKMAKENIRKYGL